MYKQISIEDYVNFIVIFCWFFPQSTAIDTLEQLETENDILRAFLQVSQAENSTLRRMSLKSFLMVPVQRVMKWVAFVSFCFTNAFSSNISYLITWH